LFNLNKKLVSFSLFKKKEYLTQSIAPGYSLWVLWPNLKSLIKILIQKRIKRIKENGKKNNNEVDNNFLIFI